ncbi:hypothetical protein Trydic_g705 [Trypoxylus dichotomus]
MSRQRENYPQLSGFNTIVAEEELGAKEGLMRSDEDFAISHLLLKSVCVEPYELWYTVIVCGGRSQLVFIGGTMNAGSCLFLHSKNFFKPVRDPSGSSQVSAIEHVSMWEEK